MIINLIIIHKHDANDPFYQIKLSSLKQEQQEGLEAAKKLNEKRENMKRKVTVTDYFDRMNEANEKNKC